MTAGGGMAIEGAYNGFKAFGPQISINKSPQTRLASHLWRVAERRLRGRNL